MKHLSSTLVLICAALTAALPLVAESLRDAVADAERLIIQKYETPVARQMAMDDLTKILKSDMSDEEKIAAIHAEFSSAPALSLSVQDKSAQVDNPANLIFRPPLQWTIHSIEIAYDVDSSTNILLSMESLYQEEERKNRDNSTGISTTQTSNKGSRKQDETSAGGNIQPLSSFNPLKWLQARAEYQWIKTDNSSKDTTSTSSSQWNERAQRALSNLYEEKVSILQNTNIKNCHLSFSVSFKNNTDSDLLYSPQDIRIPIHAGNEHLTDAVPVSSLRTVRISSNAWSDQLFRAELNTTAALKLIAYMRSNEPLIRLDRGQVQIVSEDGKVRNAVQETLQTPTVPFRCRDFELRIRKNYQGKPTTVVDAMRAVNAVFENAPFVLNQIGDCVSLIGIPLEKNGSGNRSINQLPVIGINGSFTSAVIPAAQLKLPLSEEGLSIDVLDVLARDTLKSASFQLQAYLISFLKTVAESGDAKAQNLLGVCYHSGYGVSEDYAEAVKWYRKAAEQGFAPAQAELGRCYVKGVGVQQNDTEAVKWFRKAAEQGDADAQMILCGFYLEGIGVSKNDAEAVKWIRKAAEQGVDIAQAALGDCFLQGIGVQKNEEEAVKWYRKAAEQGSTPAQVALGDCFLQGFGAQKNEEEAVKWYRKAAEQGSTPAQVALGDCFLQGFGVQKNEEEAVKWYRKVAEQGSAPAQLILGDCYSDGFGVQQNDTEAVKWYRKAAEQGFAPAQFNLGLSYHNGIGVKQDVVEAAKWMRKAAEQGDADAQFNLASYYYNGEGVKRDTAEAVKWYRKAAEQGFAPAQAELGCYYHEGIGVQKNYSEAVRWFRLSAEQDYFRGQYLLGVAYEKGDGVSRNKSEAAKWYRLAAKQGFEDAQEALNRLGN